MDIIHSTGFHASGVPRNKKQMLEYFRYTFPEIMLTNRSMGMDEDNYVENINYTFIYGLAYDMTIYRCCGDLNDIPNYAAYMSQAIKLREKYSKYFYGGKFIDTDGVSVDSSAFRFKTYLSAEGELGAAVWNWSDDEATVIFTNDKTGNSIPVTLKKNEITFVEL